MELLFRNERYCYSLWQGKKLEFKDTCFEGVYLNNFVGFLLRNVYPVAEAAVGLGGLQPP